jgi:hypothetical protein
MRTSFSIIVISILSIVFGVETFSQSSFVSLHGGYALHNGTGTNLTVSYAQKLNVNWSWKVQVGIVNTFARAHQGGVEMPEIASFMDIRRMREQEELVGIYLDPEFVEAYEGQGLGLIEKSPTTFSNKYFINCGLDHQYIQKPRWSFTFGFGIGLGIADNTRVVGGGGRVLDSIQNFVFDGIYITEEFKNSYDNQRLVKYLIFNNLLDHRVSFEIIERMSIFQYIGYNYDFISSEIESSFYF